LAKSLLVLLLSGCSTSIRNYFLKRALEETLNAENNMLYSCTIYYS